VTWSRTYGRREALSTDCSSVGRIRVPRKVVISQASRSLVDQSLSTSRSMAEPHALASRCRDLLGVTKPWSRSSRHRIEGRDLKASRSR
jgi:hypothetical protein